MGVGVTRFFAFGGRGLRALTTDADFRAPSGGNSFESDASGAFTTGGRGAEATAALADNGTVVDARPQQLDVATGAGTLLLLVTDTAAGHLASSRSTHSSSSSPKACASAAPQSSCNALAAEHSPARSAARSADIIPLPKGTLP